MRGERGEDRRQHRVRLAQHVIVPEPQHVESFVLEVLGTRAVVLPPFEMLAPVQFDHQPRLQAREVGEVGADPVLAAEFPSLQAAVSQSPPQPPLGFGLFAA